MRFSSRVFGSMFAIFAVIALCARRWGSGRGLLLAGAAGDPAHPVAARRSA
jgi:hypothetical protein